MDMDIYSGIFSIVTDELKKNNIDFRFSSDSCTYLAQCSPDEADLLDLMKCRNNRNFLETAYMAFLQRPVDEKAFNNWKEKFSMNENEFRSAVINTLITSQEFFNASVSVRNNIYASGNVLNLSVPAGSSAVRWPDRLLRIYRRQPEFIKKAVRKSMGIK